MLYLLEIFGCKMRLLFVHERFGALGGAEVNAYLTAAEFKRRGHNLAILYRDATGKNESNWREIFSELFLIGNSRNNVAKESLGNFRPDAVYVHKMSDLHVIKTLKDSGLPVVRMVHDHDLYCMRSYKYHPLTRKICTRRASPYCIFPCAAVVTRNRIGGWPFKWVSYLSKREEIRLNRHFHRMIVATEYMKDELLRNGFTPERIEIHPPVPQSNGVPHQSSFSSRNLLLFAGQIIRGKGVDVLLESLAKLRTHFECIILGDGTHKHYCQNLCRALRLDTRVTFEGYVPPEKMASYYSDASMAVVSSVWPEPFGAVGLEAMRYGLPVVAFDAGGIREWLMNGVNGFLVPLMDRTEFAARIDQLLQDKALARQMGTRGRQLADQKFSFTRYINGLEAMFDRVIAEKRTGNSLPC